MHHETENPLQTYTIWRRGLRYFLIFILGFSLLLWGVLSNALILGPKPTLYGERDFSAAIFDRHQRLLRLTLAADDTYRIWTPLRDIEARAVQATLLQEDRYFYWHPGINPLALWRAGLSAITGGPRLGASTITMQLARLRYHLHTRSATGKLRQIWEAWRFEWHYSKHDIIEAYLNLAPYGGNIEGIGAASQIYFHKAADNLTLAEAMLLSVMPQKPTHRAPSRNEPHTRDSFESRGLLAARNRLLERWTLTHPHDQKLSRMTTMTKSLYRRDQLPFLAPHFIQDLWSKHLHRQSVPLMGANISTIDLDLQQILERRLASYLERKKHIGIRNGAVMLVDYRSMDTLGLVGSADFFNSNLQGQVNGTKAKRSPGSTLKPLIYALAIDQGIIHSKTVLKDAPTSFGDWQPENFDRGFSGPINATEALIRSRNIPALQLAALLKKPSLYEFLKKIGVTDLRSEDFYGLALALGGAEVTMADLVKLYAMLANAGQFRPLRQLSTDPKATDSSRPLLSPEAAEMVLHMLRENPRPDQGYDKHWTTKNLTVAWKTGTSYSYRDAWSIGIVGPYVLAVWLGNFDGESNPALIGIEAAGPLFFEIIDALVAHHGSGRMPSVAPSGLIQVKSVSVCALSGKLPGPYCQHKINADFIPGKSPIANCDIHRLVSINRLTGQRACPKTPPAAIKAEVFEFWPSDLLRLFRQAGIPRRTPPPFGPECNLVAVTHSGLPPRILSPQTHVVYNLRISTHKTDAIPLQAATDADATDVYWFANNIYLGQASSTRPFFWRPIPGKIAIKAIDNLGRSASRTIQVQVVE